MPVWAVVTLGAIWFGLLIVIVIKRHEPRWVFPMPVLSILLWFAAAFLGDAFLHWTA